MPSIINSDNGATSGSAGLKFTSADDGVLQIQNSGTTAVSFSSAGQATFNAPVSQPGAFMFRNKIINGNFDIWQRGTSQTSNGYGSADRWSCFNSGSTKTASQQAFALGQTDVPNNPKYFMRHEVTSVSGASNAVSMGQKIEGVETLAGQTATLSFWAKADASKNIAVEFLQSFGTGGSPSTQVTGIGSQLVALTTDWTKYTITVDIPSVSGKTLGTDINDRLEFYFWFDAGSNNNARAASLGQQSGTFDIAQVQIEEGSAATLFEQRPIGIENQLCMRYYQYFGSSVATAPLAVAYMGTSTSCRFQFNLTAPLRGVPTVVIGGTNAFIRYTNSAYTGLAAVYNITSWPTASIGGGDKTCSTSVGFLFTVPTGFAGSVAIVAGATLSYFDAEL